jgi:ribonuclease HI
VILVRGTTVLCEDSGYLGPGTNNIAEYHAVINGLERAAQYTGDEVCCFSDSELVVRQLTGRYTIRKPHLAELAAQVRVLCPRFKHVEFVAIRREHPFIRRADELCNLILDARR